MYKQHRVLGCGNLPGIGKVYPANPHELQINVRQYLEHPRTQEPIVGKEAPQAGVPKAVIAPHAGYIYSGPIAASVYARLQAARDSVKRVVLIGPAHYVPFYGVVTCSYGAFETPLGQVPLDLDAIRDTLV